jgi:microcystin degradation protein MlrC
LALLDFAGTHAGAGEPRAGIDRHSKVRSILAAAGPAREFAIAKHRDRRSGGSGHGAGLLDQIVENQIEGKVYRELSTAVSGQRLRDLG